MLILTLFQKMVPRAAHRPWDVLKLHSNDGYTIKDIDPITILHFRWYKIYILIYSGYKQLSVLYTIWYL